MIYVDNPPYKTVRQAKKKDIFDITRVLRDSMLYSTVTEEVARNVENFTVFAIDDCAHAAIMVSCHDGSAEVDFLASSEGFEAPESIYRLLQFTITEAQKRNKKFFHIPAYRAPILIGIQPWFLRLGFKSQSLKTGRSNNRTKVWTKSL